MPPDRPMLEDVGDWMEKARQDLQAAEVLAAVSPPLPLQCLFHCQQCVEKALKAFLVLHGERFRKTHSVEEVGMPCAAIDPTLADLVRRAKPLTQFAWVSRYPGDFEPIDHDDATAALAVAREVYQAIAARIPQ